MIVRSALLNLSVVLALFVSPFVREASGEESLAESAEATAPVAAPVIAPVAAPVAAPPAVKPDKAPEGDEVLLSAESVERSGEERNVIAEGAVTIRHREMRLVADRAVYNETTKLVVADGNVVLDSGPDRLQGEHLELNLDTRIGFLDHAQGFVQSYYFKGERIEKRGPDHYFLRGGSFTTCEGALPDWSFHATSTEITIDEYLYTWNPTLRIRKLPVLYFPYAIFPVKRERSTGLLIPTLGLSGANGLTVRNAFYWAPRDNFDATIGLDYLQKTGWGANGEMRYLLAARTQGVIMANYLRNTGTNAESWSLATRNSHELPLGLHAEVDAFFQNDRQFIATQGATIEQRSSERTASSFIINRTWSAWNFDLSGRYEVSLITEDRTTITRFPELSIGRTSTRLFGTDLFFKLTSSAVVLRYDSSVNTLSTTRAHLSPELTWPVSLGSFARIIPTAGYAFTSYSTNTVGVEESRSIPFFKFALEGPRPYRVWDLAAGGRFTKLKHLIEPSVSYVYTPKVDQETLPQFDHVDRIAQVNRLEYSLTNTLFAKVRPVSAATSPPLPAAPGGIAGLGAPLSPAVEQAVATVDPAPPVALATTQELLWFKLSQNYTFDIETASVAGQPFSSIAWEARTRPLTGLEIQWRGDFDVYGGGFGYHNLSLAYEVTGSSKLHAEWRSARDSSQDFLDLGGNVSFGRFGVEARSRYNLGENIFVENRINVKYSSQCWDLSVGYVRWTDTYEYQLSFSLKGIGTVVRL